MRKIGLLGGSFNPPHLGHLQMAKEAYRRLGLDEVWMLVTPQNPHKTKDEIEKFQLRFEQCEIIADAHPWLKVSDFEHQHNTKYTAETIELLQKKHKGQANFVWIMGSENLAHFHKWERWKDIINNIPLICMYREEANATGINSPATTQYAEFRKKENDSLHTLPNWRIIFMPPHAGRATHIRQQLKSGEKPLHLTDKQLKTLQNRRESCKYFRQSP